MVDSMIRLFPSNATDFTTNGLGYLPDATECTVTEERNGAFELEMKYPVSGKRYSDILLRSIIVAKPNPYDDPQPFRIYEISRPMKGSITIKAEHISYDINGIPVTSGWEATSPSAAFAGLKSHAAVTCPFDFWTDKSSTGTFRVEVPSNMRSCLGGVEGSILDIYHGEYKFDKYMIRLYGSRGMNRDVSIRYGKNLTDLNQEENCASVYTGVYGYWYSDSEDDGGLVETSPKVINVPGSFNYQRILIVDFSSEFQDKPSSSQLKDRVNNYISNNNIGVPSVNLTVSFVNLTDYREYENLALLETVHLCDTVNVIFEELGVNATAKVITTVFNCLTNKYDSIELGDAKSNLANTIANYKEPDFSSDFNRILKEVQQALKENNTLQAIAIAQATKLITGNLGGHVVLHSSTGGDKPDEILIMDTADINTAKKIWRWNLSGLGYSSTGYNGPYGLAMTMNGMIVADFIQTGTMSANRIKGGTLTLGGSDNGNGVLMVLDSTSSEILKIDNNGLSGWGDFQMRKKYGTYASDYYEMGLFLNENLPYKGTNYSLYGMRVGTGKKNQVTGWGDMMILPNKSTSPNATPGSGNKIYTRTGFDIYAQNYGDVWSQILMLGSYIRFYANSEEFLSYAPTQGGTLPKLMKAKKGLLVEDIFAVHLASTISGSYTPVLYGLGSNNYQLGRASSSSIRYKEVDRDMSKEDVDDIYQIQPVFAKYKKGYLREDDERNGIYYPMFIAEDVEKYVPIAVDHNEEGKTENWNERVMIPIMFQMIKSQKEQIDNLQTRIDELKELIQNG